eukprot:CAMPEP_0115858134 /NCGR_PEP_ID=MMETSP0287-20121206/15941_1 /TAXON_ID=412157 /ORGANISM="Chrysochromulina rotalis, Strain UIO044" /LENGTH=217 /DNA_ID=CAMNT_0003312389 /DNA_START=44 /DNA_END=697 /DNA_ORIENTATION=-
MCAPVAGKGGRGKGGKGKSSADGSERPASSGPVLIGSAVLVTGNSYSVKDHLKEVGEGAWCKTLNGWVFPEAKRAEVEAACKAGGALVENGQAAKVAPTPSTDANAALKVVRHKKAILVTGDTQLVKTQLGALGGSWNRKLGGWILPGKSGGAVVALLREDPTNKVTTSDDATADAGSDQPPAKKAKLEPQPKSEVEEVEAEDEDEDVDEEESDDSD